MIRRLVESDINQVLSLTQSIQGPGFHWPESLLREECRMHDVYGSFHEEQLMAFVVVAHRGWVSELTVLASRKGAHGKGWMKGLLCEVLEKFVQGGEVWLEVHEGNLAAIKLYEGLKFQLVGRRPRYYSDGADALQYTLFSKGSVVN
ncbi:MAG: hypothetical protein BroJett040_15170 [Oligoflexia bacterium]|nr:MAG: hypothetical protein BroJett040_15170 [Oligoflexia bacterium]